MSNSDEPTAPTMVHLRTHSGQHCVDIRTVDALFDALPSGEPIAMLRISFQDVGAVSTAFASSLLTALDMWKKSHPGRRVVLCDLSMRHQRVIEMCREALQAQSPTAPLSPPSRSGS